jgi:hypothetical protein
MLSSKVRKVDIHPNKHLSRLEGQRFGHIQEGQKLLFQVQTPLEKLILAQYKQQKSSLIFITKTVGKVFIVDSHGFYQIITIIQS